MTQGSSAHRLSPLSIVLLNICLFLVAALFCIGASEVFLRLSGLQEIVSLTPDIYQKATDPVVSYELKPNLSTHAFGAPVHTNSLGFRSAEIDPSRPLLAVIGDSFTFGWGVSDTQSLPAVLQPLLPSYFVLNAGVPGYNIEQEAALYRTKIASMHPQLLVLNFLFNDFQDTMVMTDRGLASGPRDAEKAAATPSTSSPRISPALEHWLQQHSALYIYLLRATRGSFFRSAPAVENVFADTYGDADFDRYAAALQSLADASGDTPRVFVLWPTHVLQPVMRERIKVLAQKEGFHVIDLFDIFGNKYGSLGWDAHPNAATYQKVGRVILERLVHDGVIPAQTFDRSFYSI